MQSATNELANYPLKTFQQPLGTIVNVILECKHTRTRDLRALNGAVTDEQYTKENGIRLKARITHGYYTRFTIFSPSLLHVHSHVHRTFSVTHGTLRETSFRLSVILQYFESICMCSNSVVIIF